MLNELRMVVIREYPTLLYCLQVLSLAPRDDELLQTILRVSLMIESVVGKSVSILTIGGMLVS